MKLSTQLLVHSFLLFFLIISNSAEGQSPVLLAHYSLNGDFNDNSGNGHNFSGTNLSYGNDRNNTANGACIFNGSSSISKLTNASAFNFSNTDSFSITFWMNVASITDYAAIISKCEESDTSGYAIGFDNTGKLRVITNLLYPVNSSQAIALNQWQHISVTYANELVSIYINGTISGSGKVANLNTNNLGLIFGRLYNVKSNPTYYNGLLDDFRIYKSLLTASQIGSIVASTKENKLSPSILKVYPTVLSSSESVNIDCSLNDFKVQIINQMGQIIQEENNKKSIPAEQLPAGIYIIQVFNQDVVNTSRIIVTD